jgi:hypothetical protein
MNGSDDLGQGQGIFPASKCYLTFSFNPYKLEKKLQRELIHRKWNVTMGLVQWCHHAVKLYKGRNWKRSLAELGIGVRVSPQRCNRIWPLYTRSV